MTLPTLGEKNLLLIALGLVAVQIAALLAFGQPFLCECGELKVWEGEVASAGNSQQVSDWYTPSHIIHGILFFALFSWLWPRSSLSARLLTAVALEISWEIIENTPMVIDHYRQQALAAGYAGDSILNSLSDTLAMVGGFFLAARLPYWATLLIIIVFEVLVMYAIRDGLLLNIINLIYPLEFITTWQSAGY